MGMDLEWTGDGEELGGIEGVKTLIKIYPMRKEPIFNKKLMATF